MQLIFETETTVSIVEKMTSLDSMAIAESKPDSSPNVTIESKCNLMEINNIHHTVKPDEKGNPKEQNGDVNVAMMTESAESTNDVVNKDKENYISAQNGVGDIADPVSTKDTKIAQIASENLMQIENKLPGIPENLEIANNLPTPENKIKDTEFINDIIKQDVVQEKVNPGLDIKENIPYQQEKLNENTDVEIQETKGERNYSATKNGEACEAKIDDIISVLDSSKVKSYEKELTKSSQVKETNTPDFASKKNLEPKNSIDHEFRTADCIKVKLNAAYHGSSASLGDNVTTLDNNCQDRTKTTNGTHDSKKEPRDQELEMKSADEAQESKIKVTDHESSNKVLKHKKKATDLEEDIKYTEDTQDNKKELSYNKEVVKSSNEAEVNKMEVIHHEEVIKSTDKAQEVNMAAYGYDEETKPTDQAQDYEMEVTNRELEIKSNDGAQENNVEATDHEGRIKSTDEVIESKIEVTDHRDGMNISEHAPENNEEFTVHEAEIKTIEKMQESDCTEKNISCDETQEKKIKLIEQLNSSEEKCRQDSLEFEQRIVDDNNKSVLDVNSDYNDSNACDKSILNSNQQGNSVKELKENCVEKSYRIKGGDNLSIGNYVNNETQLQNIIRCDSDKKNDSEIKDISKSRVVSPKQVIYKDCKASALEVMDVHPTEDLTTDYLAVPNKSVTPVDTILDQAISDDIISVDSCKTINNDTDRKSSPVTVIDCDEIQDTSNKQSFPHQEKENETTKQKKTNNICGLSNTLDILSDDDDCVEECKNKLPEKTESLANENKCINLDEDDDVMLIDDAPIDKEPEVPKIADYMPSQGSESINQKKEDNTHNNDLINTINLDNDSEPETSKMSTNDNVSKDKAADVPLDEESKIQAPEIGDKSEGPIVSPKEIQRPIIPENFLKAFRKNVVDMNRDELEEFCLMKIVEGIIDQTNLSEIKTKLKTMSSYVDEWKKKVMALTKQNRDLQIVLKTVQDEQKKRSEHQVVPLKITRSVGMQVYMAEVVDRNAAKRKAPQSTPVVRNNRNTLSRPSVKLNSAALPIPVPRLVPAPNNSPMKTRLPQQVQNATVTSNSPKQFSQNGMKTPSPVQKSEKRPFSSVQSVTVDLTDDEPPTKQPATARNNAQQAPVRLVAQQQLMKPRAQTPMGNTTARKVFIPINPQNNIRPGQTITLKSVPPNARIRGPGPQNQAVPIRVQANAVRGSRPNSNVRHPAPLPEVAKQQQPPNWKALPPAPDLKISKVENGIVISWKIEGYQEDSYEEIASYQLYAYQETSSPPSTLLWKKIGDVKALPLPMACTLTQFMAGYKYYFAVRAVDIRSRIGAFSLPGSILLLNK